MFVFEDVAGFAWVDLGAGVGSAAALDLPKRKENIFVWKDERKDRRMKSEEHFLSSPILSFNFFSRNK